MQLLPNFLSDMIWVSLLRAALVVLIGGLVLLVHGQRSQNLAGESRQSIKIADLVEATHVHVCVSAVFVDVFGSGHKYLPKCSKTGISIICS